ncbi:MAG: helix-turn-helix domain-containing protein [Alphaproteobacteria bacterium]
MAEVIDAVEKRLRDNPSIQKKYLNSEEAARYLGLASCSAMASMRRAGDGPVYSRPSWRMVFYTEADIDAWLEERRERRNPSTRRKPGDPTPGAGS